MDDLNDKEDRHQMRPLVRQITVDGSNKLEIYRPTTNPIYIYTQVSTENILNFYTKILRDGT